MANIFSPSSLGINAPTGGFQQGGWYQGRQYWGGTLSEPGVIHPSSNQQGAGQAVSAEVNAQSAAQQGVSPQNFEGYLQQQRQASANVAPAASYSAPAPTGGGGDMSGLGGGGASFNAPAVPDLLSLKQSTYAAKGISDMEAEYQKMQDQFTIQKAKLGDNPFLSEASRVGREAKLQKLFTEQTANLLDKISTAKADADMEIQLAMKQYDINSEAAKTAFSQFNSLLESGAFQNASGQDIASWTKATGISSSMIYSAIKAQQAKNVKTDIVKFDDGTNQGFVVYDTKTGNIINKQVVAASEPSKSTSTSGGLTATQTRSVTSDARKAIATVDTNTDKALSLEEFQKAISNIMTATGVDQQTAATSAAQAMSDLGYVSWKWNTK